MPRETDRAEEDADLRVMKSPEDLAEILGYCGEDSLYTVESMRQADYLESWSRQRGKKDPDFTEA